MDLYQFSKPFQAAWLSESAGPAGTNFRPLNAPDSFAEGSSLAPGRNSLSAIEPPRILSLFQIGPHDIDQFLGGGSLRGIFGAIWVQHMEPDMPLDQFGHQAIQRSAASRQQLKHSGALVLFPQRAFDGLHLSANSTSSDQEFFLVSRRVCHERYYTITQYSM